MLAYIILSGVFTKVLAVWLPSNDICKPGAEFRILIVGGNLTSLETETRVNPKALIVEISLERLVTAQKMHGIREN